MLTNILFNTLATNIAAKSGRQTLRAAVQAFRFSEAKKTESPVEEKKVSAEEKNAPPAWSPLDDAAKTNYMTQYSALFDKLKEAEKVAAELKEKKVAEEKKFDRIHKEISEARNDLEKKINECEKIWTEARKKIDTIKTENFVAFGKDLIKISHHFQALQDCLKESDPQDLAQGVHMTNKILIQNLERYGFKRIDPQNEKFNLNEHRKEEQVEGGKAEKGTVVGVVQKGWKFGDKVIEPARVRVSK